MQSTNPHPGDTERTEKQSYRKEQVPNLPLVYARDCGARKESSLIRLGA